MTQTILYIIIGVAALVTAIVVFCSIGWGLDRWEDHKLAIEATKPAHDDGGDVDDD